MARIASFIAAHVSRPRVRLSSDDIEFASRAFCPGASPPDNSCSPANKGIGSPRPPASPEPDGKATDPRGAATGHSAKQREGYASELAKWLKDTHGVDMAIDAKSYEEGGPPTMDAMRQVADGIAQLKRLEIDTPQLVVFADLPGNAPGAYDYLSGTVMADPDGTQEKLSNSIERGWLAGTLSSEQWGLMVHEMTHHDHRESIKNAIADRDDITDEGILATRTIERVKTLMGIDADGKGRTEPWDPSARFGLSARRDPDNGGGPLPADLAREAAKEVSGYAATNPLEFVAEVRTGVAAGITYSDQVMKLYEDYGGPRLPRRRRD